MKPSDYFKTMDEVKAYVESQRAVLSDEEYKALKLATGLNEQMGVFEELDGIGQVDRTIAPIIALLNQHGYITNSSCSGLKSEHEEWKKYEFRGYIAVIDDGNETRKRFIRDLVTGLPFTYEEEEVYLQPAYTIRVAGSDEIKTEAWKQLLKRLKQKLSEVD